MHLTVPSDCVPNVCHTRRGLALADAHVRAVHAGELVASGAGAAAALHAAHCDHLDALALRRQSGESDVRALQSRLLHCAQTSGVSGHESRGDIAGAQGGSDDSTQAGLG